MANEGFYVDRNKTASSIYCSVNGKATPVQRLYGRVDGKTELIWGVEPPAFIESLTYMQDCANYSLAQLKKGMAVEKPYTLVDERDGTQYTIALLKDGNIWMCENLRIGNNSTGMTLFGQDSDLESEDFSEFYLPRGSTSGFDKYDANYLYIDSTYGGYYSWYTATAGTGTKAMTSGNAPYSILPRGWRLPTGGSGGEFQTLANAYGSSESEQNTNLRKTPIPGFVLSGCYYYSSSPVYQGSEGWYWSSTVYNTYYVYLLILSSSECISNTRNLKFNGLSIRGICKGNGFIPEINPPVD